MKFHFCNLQIISKGTSLCRTASFDVLSVKIHAGVSAVGDWKNQKSGKHAYRVANMGVYISRIWEKTLNGLSPILSR